MKILITGGTGFLGNALLEKLQNSNYQIGLTVRSAVKLGDLVLNNKADCVLININDQDWKVQVKQFQPEVVIHLASYLTSADDEQAIEKLIAANLSFGTHLLDALKGTNIQLFINTGTFAEYLNNSTEPDPAYLYAATKTAFRSIVKYYSFSEGFSVLNVIPYTIYGKQDSQKKVIDRIYDSLGANMPQNMSPGNQQLDFIHIDDVTSFYLNVLSNVKKFVESKTLYEEIHLGTGIGTTPKEVADIMEGITQLKANINWGGIAYRKRDTLNAVANRLKPQQFLNWQPTITLKDGLKSYIKTLEKSTNEF